MLSEDRYPIWIPGCSERIVFSSNRTGEYRIFSVDPNGMNPSQLTIPAPSVTEVDLYPAWSGLPAHLRAVEGACCIPGVAFDSLREGIEQVYVMRADGFRLTPLTLPPNHPGRNMSPAPSRDGTKIAFQSSRDGRFQIYWIPVTGGPAVRLTNSSGNDTSPIWSNDGRHIAFVSTRDGPNAQLYVMVIDPATMKMTSERRFTTDPNRIDNNPSWFPEDDRIVFQSRVGTGNDDIYMINSDGTGLAQLTRDPATDGHPTVSPDAQWIAFESNRSGKYQIYVMRLDGSDLKQITSEGENRQPYWCPSCLDRIVFSSDRKGDGFRIYTMNGDGDNQVRLTSLAGGLTKPDQSPAWSGLPLPAFPPTSTLPPAQRTGGAGVLVAWLGGVTSGIHWPREQQ
jgi:TolB protein